MYCIESHGTGKYQAGKSGTKRDKNTKKESCFPIAEPVIKLLFWVHVKKRIGVLVLVCRHGKETLCLGHLDFDMHNL
jgi:hypothetical protein